MEADRYYSCESCPILICPLLPSPCTLPYRDPEHSLVECHNGLYSINRECQVATAGACRVAVGSGDTPHTVALRPATATAQWHCVDPGKLE